jgi:DNA-binding GntR family transcriptional regulator
MSTDNTGQHETYGIVYAGHMLSTVITMTDETSEADQDPIDPRGYDTAYQVVARRLERRIRSGEFAFHMPIPSEPALADWYGVSRTTVRSGIRLLAESGMVEVRHGKGTYVTWQPETT